MTTAKIRTKAKAKAAWDKILKYIKDIIYVSLFIIAVGTSIFGWIKASQKESAEAQSLKSTVENNTAVMNDLKDELKNINTFLLDQKELNGQFKEFMDDQKRNKK